MSFMVFRSRHLSPDGQISGRFKKRMEMIIDFSNVRLLVCDDIV